MTAWTLHTDPNGDRCLWHGDTAVIRPADLGPHVPHGYRELLFDDLVALRVQPPEVVERVAEAMWNCRNVAAPKASWLEIEQVTCDLFRRKARAALAALAPDVPPPARDPVAHMADAVSRVLPDWTERLAEPVGEADSDG